MRDAPLRRARPWRPWVAAAAVVLAAHALLLDAFEPPAPARPAAEVAAAPVQVRQIVAEAAPSPAVALVAAADVVPVAQRPTPSPAPAEVRRPAVATAVPPATEPAPPPAPLVPEPPAVELPADTPAERVAAAPVQTTPRLPAAGERDAAAPPVYPTRMPPPARLLYELRRSGFTGRGEIGWRPEAGRYELTLDGRLFGMNVIGQTSRGGFDAAGLAPERFLDRRRGRAETAANFQRAAGRITFSGPSVEYPLLAGAQDRLSWMFQLSAIAEAAPRRLEPGAQVSLFVVGSRGDGDVWTFTVDRREALQLPAGAVPDTVRLHREPRKPFDTGVQVWLDPSRHHLPVRLVLSGGDGEATEFRLSGVEAP
jgi:hypothetical protein